MHNIRGFIGKEDIINEFRESWIDLKSISLKQGLMMILLTDEFFDDVRELFDSKLDVDYSSYFTYFTPAICKLLEQESKSGKLAYIETEYFGGVGSQSAILYEKGKIKIDATKTENVAIIDKYLGDEDTKEKAINVVLKELGAYREKNKDEFESVGLNNFRRME